MNRVNTLDTPKTLEKFAEECAEAIQVKSKIVCYGLWDQFPPGGADNRQRFEVEIGHVLAYVDILKEQGVLTDKGLEAAKQQKRKDIAENKGGWY